MARHPAIGSLLRTIMGSATAFGLMAGYAPRRAAAQSVPLAAPSGDSAEAAPVLESAPNVSRDQYPARGTGTNLVLAGAVTTGVWYSLALGSSFLWPDTVGAKDLRIPVAGPWMALSHSGCGNVSSCSEVIVVIRAIVTTLDAIGQASGLAIAGEGLFLPTQEPKRTHAALKQNSFEIQPTFDAGRNTVGLGVLGVF